ncbi:endonuclease 2-like [Carex rostrata]
MCLRKIPISSAWGTDGHYMVCKIAQSYLTSTASSTVLKLLSLSANGDLASECSWADNLRTAYPWSSALHYVDTPDNLCTYDYTRDCHDSSRTSGRCVVGAINNYTTQLKTYSLTTYKLTQALMFLAHFMGDVHQPLHVGFTMDAGGNSITVHWYNVQTNLHSVWDTKIIQISESNYFGNVVNRMSDSIKANITDGIVSESISQACSYAYKNAPNGAYLSDTCYLSRKSVVNTRIAQGGVRLANFLNQIFMLVNGPTLLQPNSKFQIQFEQGRSRIPPTNMDKACAPLYGPGSGQYSFIHVEVFNPGRSVLDWDGVTDDLRQNVCWSGSCRHRWEKMEAEVREAEAEVGEGGRGGGGGGKRRRHR